MIDVKKQEIQDKAVQAWIDKGCIGTIEAITGIGKTFIFIQACFKTLEEGSKILFLAETTSREYDLMMDIDKYAVFYGKKLTDYYDLTFMTYQSAYKKKNTKWDLVCADEIHDSASPRYSEFYYNNNYDKIIGLSATIIRYTKYIDEEGKEFTKGDLIDKIAPVCYRYTIKNGQEDNTARPLKIHVIYHKLDSITKNIEAGNKLKRFYTTEKESYDYWDAEFKKAIWISDLTKKEWRLRITSAARAKVLYTLPSKIKAVQELLSKLKGKTLLFGNDLSTLLKITPDVVCSRYNDVKNQEIRDKFDSGEISLIGSFKKLKQGANLSNLDNVVIMSYYSTTKDIIQRIGRMRKDGNKVGNVYIFLTQNSQEIVWFNKMTEQLQGVDIVYYNSVNQID